MHGLKVGQTVYVKKDRRELEETTIEKVGRKYIYCKHCNGMKFDKNTLMQVNYIGYPARIYLTKKEYENSITRSNLITEIQRVGWSAWHKLALEQLKIVDDILKEALDEN